ncbi:hypothetical protein COW36_10265 [bacterium (Candidatus Blackallbacteria) CG17_big_fil_post_rev_8_21_14_2_50_48_46]|uniref:Lipoprotein n=1 Tax=bacterium (Candidatus Blackallbacteria) CG17_big_fil_post_rev_8_21_14_2_50_48_46 TaxID=2014261 RepID=A0A2M7G500_9BACT|nr:MAG: hypothetical protein COW64_20035 [bacterium (Candidatus Blackallbacteria) CG18_big_fil_WC_8_21_14_2_50_49_26]PIW17017.1 MAG: hypothetical protein COW36_10265 [bacterium (Candidatus Blackallbacteria) CG17_big_fil_post_rev_8_21_14_2_50_48_46]PIW48175.1 MAG: hypothetical protein COW20_10410 [bacterium (Candidatus Blackallbacteria) CG13_big_fil_rev_8_21_14_2_50_49_14]
MFKRLASFALLLGFATACAPQVSPLNTLNPAQIQAQSRRTPQTAPNHLFKVQEGFEWVYEVTAAPVMDPYDEKKMQVVLRTEKVIQTNGETILELRFDDPFSNGYTFPALRLTPQGALVQGATYLGAGADYIEGLQVDFMHMPLATGARWEEENWLAKVIGPESITMPAGQFNATRVDVIGTFQQYYTNVGDYWITPGLGIVYARYTIPGWHVEMKLVSTAVRKQATAPQKRAPLAKGQPTRVTSRPVIK